MTKKTAKPFKKSKKDNNRLYIKEAKQLKRKVREQLQDLDQTQTQTYYF